MKKILLIALLLSLPIFAQVRTFVDSLTASDTTYHYVPRAYDFAVLTITLSSANDTVIVYTGTTESSPKYGIVAVMDMTTNDDVIRITGNTTTNRKYQLFYGRQKYIALVSTSNGATVHYTLEAF